MSLIVNDQVDLSIRQFAEAWRLMCGTARGSSITSRDGLDYVFSGIPIPFFNVALLTACDISADGLKSRAQEACALASRIDVPWMFVLTHDAVDADVNVPMVLDDCNLGPLMPLTGVLTECVAPSTSVPAGLELCVPRADAEYSAILDVNSAAYGMDLSAGKELIGTADFWANHSVVVGSVDGVAAASAAVMMVDGYRYVLLVATDPAHRRRGYADAVMRRALELSASVHGERPTVLHATDAGRPVYERMGYRTISTHTVFMDKRFLAEH